jgi:AraC family transcriptional regulator
MESLFHAPVARKSVSSGSQSGVTTPNGHAGRNQGLQAPALPARRQQPLFSVARQPMTKPNEAQRVIAESGACFPGSPLLTSRNRHWEALTVDLHAPMRGAEFRVPAMDRVTIFCALRGGGRLYQRRGGRQHEAVIQSGQVMIVPAFQEAFYRGDTVLGIGVYLPVLHFASAVRDMEGSVPGSWELRHVFQTRDTVLEQFCVTLLHELERPEHPTQTLFVNATAVAMTAHLLRSYDIRGGQSASRQAGLAGNALNSVISYIEDNVHRRIPLDELAGVAGVSRYHFARVFKISTSLSPMAYVERTRIRRAQEMIRTTNFSLSQIAQRLGFSDQAHFGRRFKAQFGSAPGIYRRTHE